MSASQAEDLKLAVGGMNCAGCAMGIRGILRNQPGVVEAQVDFATREADIRFDPKATKPETLVQAIRDAGYQAELPLDPHSDPLLESSKQEEAEAQSLLRGAMFASGLGLMLMILSVPLMAEHGSHHDPISAFYMRVMEAPVRLLLPFLFWVSPVFLGWVSLLLGLVALVFPGRVFFTRAFKNLSHGRVDMNTLVALGSGVAWIASAAGMLWPEGPLGHGNANYFEGIAWLVAFVLLGQALEHRARGQASNAVRALLALRPEKARLILPGEDKVVPLATIRPGDHLRVIPGDRVPVDGEIVNGSTEIDEALLTGEPLPILRQKGDRVTAGTLNRTGSVEVVARALGADSVVGRLAKMVRQAQTQRAPMEKLADQISSWFVPVVLVLSLLCLGGWLWYDQGAWDRGLARSVAVLVVACPCALGLAMPVAIVAGLGRGARLGILFKGGDSLASAASIRHLFLDKTGTLTIGQPKVISSWYAPQSDQQLVAGWAIALEKHSEHPLAKAILHFEKAHLKSPAPEATEVQALAGKGISASIDGETFCLGTVTWLKETGAIDGLWVEEATKQRKAGQTLSALSRDKTIIALWGLDDPMRPDAPEAIKRLGHLGVTLELISGDQPEAVARLAQSAGIANYHGQVSPEGKLTRIDDAKSRGLKVGMVGDGLNDGPALAKADLGIAMAAGADLAIEAAGVTLMRPDLTLLPSGLQLARATKSIINQNLGWAFGYNLIAIPFAAGLLEPWLGFSPGPALAGLAMAFSSVTVVFNSLRLLVWKP